MNIFNMFNGNTDNLIETLVNDLSNANNLSVSGNSTLHIVYLVYCFNGSDIVHIVDKIKLKLRCILLY